MLTKAHIVKAMVFPIVMHGCKRWEEGWMLKNLCLWIAVLEKTLESPLDYKEIKPVNPKGNQSWIFLEGLMLKLQYFGHLIRRASSLEKPLRLGKIEGRRRRGWQRTSWLDGTTDSMDMFEQTWGYGERQGSLVCCSPWGCKELDMTEWLNQKQHITYVHDCTPLN